MIDERTEQLINRKLDGELTDGESLELDKLLIRDPQARVMLEQLVRIDTQAGEVLRAVTSASVAAASAVEVAAWAPRRQHWWQSLGLVTAVAATITLTVLLSQRALLLEGQTPVSPQSVSAPQVVSASGAPRESEWNIQGPRRETLDVDRDVIGVWDRQSGSLYLIEANSTRSLVEPVKVNY